MSEGSGGTRLIMLVVSSPWGLTQCKSRDVFADFNGFMTIIRNHSGFQTAVTEAPDTRGSIETQKVR